MMSRNTLIFKMIVFSCLLQIVEIKAQDAPFLHILYEKGKPPIEGTWMSMEDENVYFKNRKGVENTYKRSDIDSIVHVKVVASTEHLKAIRSANPDVTIDANFDINDMVQEHSVETNWGQKYAGIVTKIAIEKLVLTTQNGMDIPFLMREVKSITVIESKKNAIQNYKTLDISKSKNAVVFKRKKEKTLSANISIPPRIGIVPTAFSLNKGTILYRNSGVYLNEFLFGAKYFNVALGNRIFEPFIKLQATIPVQKYLHVSLLTELSFHGGLFNDLFEFNRLAFSPIVTIGTPDYFLNLSYKSKAPIFLPINDAFDNSPIRPARYLAFGAGVKLSRLFKFMTESMLIGERAVQRHYRVYMGLSMHLKNQDLGLGFSIYDADNRNENFSSFANLNGFAPSVYYTVRFR